MLQINVRWNGNRVKSPFHLLDPIVNIRVGAKILHECILSYPDDFIRGLGCYNAGKSKKPALEKIAYRYGNRVMSIYNNLTKKEDSSKWWIKI